MEALLLEPVADTNGLARALQVIAQCRQEVAALRAQVAGLRRENLELRPQAGYCKGMHAQATRRIAALEQEIEQLRGENRKLQAQAFGRRSELSTTRDRSNCLEGETDPTPARQPRGPRRGRRGPQRRDYRYLPVVTEESVLPPEQQVCPTCGLALTPSGAEDSEQVEIEVRAYRRRRYQRTCWCRNCPQTVTAPPAPEADPKGLYRGSCSNWVRQVRSRADCSTPTASP